MLMENRLLLTRKMLLDLMTGRHMSSKTKKNSRRESSLRVASTGQAGMTELGYLIAGLYRITK
jgi:hypothetical protein